MKLINRPVNRLFAFGCSFTHYGWTTWPEIVAYDLDIPMYNLGRSGAGNQYIANMVAQANEIYGFTADDLIMICWSGYIREDRWFDHNWQTAGEVSSYNIYDEHFVNTYMQPEWCFIRDFAVFSHTKRLLEALGCQHHMFSMAELWRPEQPFGVVDPERTQIASNLKTIYHDVLESMLPSFFETLWDGDMHAYKSHQQKELWDNRYTDWHPLIPEQLEYMQKLFYEHKFREQTLQAADQKYLEFVDFINYHIAHCENPFFNTMDLDKVDHDKLEHLFHIKQSEPFSPLLIR